MYEGLGLEKYPLWIAQIDTNRPAANPIWGRRYDAWQYSDTGRVSGIGTNTDLDIFYEGIFLDGKKDLPGSRKKESKDRRVIYYEVQDGNTLSSIARRYGVSVKELERINGLTNPDEIYPGEVLKIESSRTSKDKEGYGDFYVVQRGDSLSTIGKRFNKTEKQLLEDNNITSNKEVIPGHVIKID